MGAQRIMKPGKELPPQAASSDPLISEQRPEGREGGGSGEMWESPPIYSATGPEERARQAILRAGVAGRQHRGGEEGTGWDFGGHPEDYAASAPQPREL